MTPMDVDQVELLPCPFCGQHLRISSGYNSYGRCETDGCWMHERMLAVPTEEVRQLSQWNTRSALTPAQPATPALMDEVREVLEVFAMMADEWDRWQAKGSTSTKAMIRVGYGRCRIGLEDYQNARAVLAKLPPAATSDPVSLSRGASAVEDADHVAAAVAAEPHVFLDCDGVLADFDTYAEAYFGMPPRQYEAKVGSAVFWQELEAKGDFYRNLPLMADARDLYEGVKHLHPTILTGCPRGNWAQGQKVAWAAEHFPGVPIITCRSADKRDYAKPGDVLIDDWAQHRHRWIEMGGVFITHHDAASSLAALWAHYPTLGRALPPEGDAS